MTTASTEPSAAPARERRILPLRDIGVAPENLRFGDPPDDELAQLAATIKAAGVLQPLTVRPGRRKEKPAMALDGRRRLLALGLLLEAGEIDDGYLVDAFVETEPARQGAAAVLTNTAVPVHVADVIGAIGKMLKAKLDIAAISRALGYGEVEIKRLAALSGLHPKALEALKAGRLNLRQARLLARLADRKAQAEIAASVLQGAGFPEYRVHDALDEGKSTVEDRRMVLVGRARYAAAGGRIEADLFGERPDVLLDPPALERAWCERAEALATRLASEDLEVRVSPNNEFDWPGGIERLAYGYGGGLDAEQIAAWRAAKALAGEAAEAAAQADPSSDDADETLIAYCKARLAADQAAEPGRRASLLVLCPGGATGLELFSFAPPLAAAPDEPRDDPQVEGEDEGAVHLPPPPRPEPIAAPPEPEIEGVNHALHETRTDAATRVLIRALADDPAAAMSALLARLFEAIVVRPMAASEAASTVSARAYGHPRLRVIDSLDGDVRRRLAERREALAASGLSTIGWTSQLADDDRASLLAELVALSLDLREERTGRLRRRARGEAAELAALCGADAARHWTPDEPFLRAHSKAQLLAMLGEMGADPASAGGLKKEELVTRTAREAAERSWAPAWLSWRGPVDDGPDEAQADTPALAA